MVFNDGEKAVELLLQGDETLKSWEEGLVDFQRHFNTSRLYSACAR